MYLHRLFILLIITLGWVQSIKLEWWQDSIFYQIYPRSFKDSDNDGIGDIKGIIEKLPHLNEIGVQATWLSPIFKSPMLDFGYDISNFRDIQDEYGTMKDFEDLLQEAKKLGIKIILDFVPNHSSHQHEWFGKSVRREKGYENYYVWHPGKVNTEGKREPPNNWISEFGGSGWEWNEQRQEYYYHRFLKEQPDLNYRDESLVEEMKEILRFWLEKGVAGFRVDAVSHLVEEIDSEGNPHGGVSNQPETFDVIHDWVEVLKLWSITHDNISRVMMLEAVGDQATYRKFYETGASFPFNFILPDLLKAKSHASDYVDIINEWLVPIPHEKYTSNWVLGNHDRHRVATRLGYERVDGLNMMLQMLPGIAITYNADELGVEDGHVTWEEHQDNACTKGNFHEKCRDFERTPFPWDTTKNAGFSNSSKTWLPVDASYKTVNCQAQRNAQESHLHVYREMSELRKEPALRYGQYNITNIDNVLVVNRYHQDENEYLFLFNVGDVDAKISLNYFSKTATVVIRSVNASHSMNEHVDTKEIFVLKAYEAYVLQLP